MPPVELRPSESEWKFLLGGDFRQIGPSRWPKREREWAFYCFQMFCTLARSRPNGKLKTAAKLAKQQTLLIDSFELQSKFAKLKLEAKRVFPIQLTVNELGRGEQ